MVGTENSKTSLSKGNYKIIIVIKSETIKKLIDVVKHKI